MPGSHTAGIDSHQAISPYMEKTYGLQVESGWRSLPESGRHVSCFMRRVYLKQKKKKKILPKALLVSR